MPRAKTEEARQRRITRFATPVHEDDLEFIQAIEEYKRKNDQPFLSWSEVLGVVKQLGYSKPGR